MRILFALPILLCAPACAGTRPPTDPAPVATAIPVVPLAATLIDTATTGECAPNDRMPVHRPGQVPRIPNARPRGAEPMPNACPVASTPRTTVVYVPTAADPAVPDTAGAQRP